MKLFASIRVGGCDCDQPQEYRPVLPFGYGQQVGSCLYAVKSANGLGVYLYKRTASDEWRYLAFVLVDDLRELWFLAQKWEGEAADKRRELQAAFGENVGRCINDGEEVIGNT